VHIKPHLIRLLAAVAASVGSCFFVIVYSRLSHLRFRFEHPDGSFIRATEFLSQSAWIGYSVPAVALLTGILALRRTDSSPVFIETIIALTWLLSLLWVGCCILIWQSQNIPTFNHMEWHY
jgi:hypothetical protein